MCSIIMWYFSKLKLKNSSGIINNIYKNNLRYFFNAIQAYAVGINNLKVAKNKKELKIYNSEDGLQDKNIGVKLITNTNFL